MLFLNNSGLKSVNNFSPKATVGSNYYFALFKCACLLYTLPLVGVVTDHTQY